MSLLSRCRARSSMLRCLSGHSHKCSDAWPNSSTRGSCWCSRPPSLDHRHLLGRAELAWFVSSGSLGIHLLRLQSCCHRSLRNVSDAMHGLTSDWRCAPGVRLPMVRNPKCSSRTWSGVSNVTRNVESRDLAMLVLMRASESLQLGSGFSVLQLVLRWP